MTNEKNQVQTGNLTHCWKTMQLIKFHLVKNMKGNRGSKQVPGKFSLSFRLCFFYHMVKFVVSLISLSSVHLFVCFILMLTNARSI